MQPTFARNALVRVGAEEALHQHREPGALRFFPYRHFQRIVNLRQQRAALAVGQKTVVPHHFKMPRRDMADVTLQHLLLAQLLAFVLLRAVVVILMHHGPSAVVAQLRCRHRRAFQVPVFVADMADARQAAKVDARKVVALQVNDGVAPDGFHLFLFKEQLPPDVVFDVKTAAGDEDMEMRMLIELSAVGMERAKNADSDALLVCPAEQRIKQRPVVVEERP